MKRKGCNKMRGIEREEEDEITIRNWRRRKDGGV
jgi:hypothetical protein